MLDRLCRFSFWLAALAAALALLAPPRLGTMLTALASAAAVAAWGLWRLGLSVARRRPVAHAAAPVATLGDAALLEVALGVARAVDAAGSFDAALLGAAGVLTSELGLRNVRALRVALAQPGHAELAELIDGPAAFCAAARRVRLEPQNPLSRALLHGEIVIGAQGGSVLAVTVDARPVAVLELGAPAMPVCAPSLQALLALTQTLLSRRAARPAPAPGGESRAPQPAGATLDDNALLRNHPALAMSTPCAPLPSPAAPDDLPPAGAATAAIDAGTTQPAGDRLDPEALARLNELDPKGENELVKRVLKAFANSAARLMPQLEAARAGADLAAIRYVAHTLKSSSASIGALALSSNCADIEAMVRSAEADHLPERLDAMRRQIDAVLAEIDRMLGVA